MRGLATTVLLAIGFSSAHAGDGKLAPRVRLGLDKGELHEWTFCPAKSLVAVSQGKQLLIGRLDVANGKLAVLSKLPFDGWAVELSPDCSRLALGRVSAEPEEARRRRWAEMWRVDDGKLTRLGEIDHFRYPVSSIAMSGDGRWLAIAANSGELNIYRVSSSGTTERTYQAPLLGDRDQYLRLRWGKNKLLGGLYKGRVRLFTLDAAIGELSAPVELMEPTQATREVGSLDAASGDVVMPGGARVLDVAMAPDGSRAWAVVETGQVFTWEVGEVVGPRVAVVDQLTGANQLAVSSDGALLAAAGDFEARVWKLDGTRAILVGVLDGLTRAERYVALSDLQFVGRRVLAAGSGNLETARLLLFWP